MESRLESSFTELLRVENLERIALIYQILKMWPWRIIIMLLYREKLEIH